MTLARAPNDESLRDTFQGREHFKQPGAITPYYGAILDLADVLSAYASYTGIFRPQAAQDE
ncbi:hypothetical protein [Nitrobacter winogradskyi]|nr:hypothetical protein [Nitrobacter winogradskyi]